MSSKEIHVANGRMSIPVSHDPSPKTLPPINMVEHPPHYNKGGFEAADVIDAFELPYHLATVTKYVLRCQFKGEKLEDLRKAAWHLNRQIELEEKNA